MGTAGGTKYGYGEDGKPFQTKDLIPGKPEGIYLLIGRRPYASFGNSTGDHDAAREYAYRPALRLLDSKVGTFIPASITKPRRTVRR